MSEKPTMYASPEGLGLTSSVGSGLHKKVYVGAKVHSGPKDAMDRPVQVVLTPEDAVMVAASLLGHLTPEELTAAPTWAQERLRGIVRVLDAAKKAAEKAVAAAASESLKGLAEKAAMRTAKPK
jgi:hypothetical protein